MPELPEVETILSGLKPQLEGKIISDVKIRCTRLRWDLPLQLAQTLNHQRLKKCSRRGKYLLFEFKAGTLLIHLGMSGRLRLFSMQTALGQPPGKHDHVDIYFANQLILRFTDPRRFGAILWTEQPQQQHPLLKLMGPEPLDPYFTENHLWQRSRRRKIAVKAFIMDSKTVAGIGNIYATEALFIAGVRPTTPAGLLNLSQYKKLAAAIKIVLQNAIKSGGTTLKDFMQSDGSSGHFKIKLFVYGRAHLPCLKCKSPLKNEKIGQRSTVYCEKCQK